MLLTVMESREWMLIFIATYLFLLSFCDEICLQVVFFSLITLQFCLHVSMVFFSLTF